MRNPLDYAGFAQLCGRSAIMSKIMRAHNRIIPRSLPSVNCSVLFRLLDLSNPQLLSCDIYFTIFTITHEVTMCEYHKDTAQVNSR